MDFQREQEVDSSVFCSVDQRGIEKKRSRDGAAVPRSLRKSLILMERETGIEPATFSLGMRRPIENKEHGVHLDLVLAIENTGNSKASFSRMRIEQKWSRRIYEWPGHIEFVGTHLEGCVRCADQFRLANIPGLIGPSKGASICRKSRIACGGMPVCP